MKNKYTETDAFKKGQFFTAVRDGDLETCKALIEPKIVDVNTISDPTYNGYTALHYAAQWNKGKTEICKFLLDNQANINAKGSLGETPLHLAYSRSNSEIIKLLLERGADQAIKSDGGYTPEQWTPTDDYHVDLSGLLGTGF